MEPTEAYNFLFADSIMSTLILPMSGRLVFPAMQIFGGYNLYLMVAIATAGTVLGAAANWFVGKLIVIACKYNPDEQTGRAQKFVNFCRKNGLWLLILSWIPVFGTLLTAALGAVGVRFKRVLAIIFIVNLVYYSSLVIS
jgi:membrane protein YqaA with SNARE-associated domain